MAGKGLGDPAGDRQHFGLAAARGHRHQPALIEPVAGQHQGAQVGVGLAERGVDHLAQVTRPGEGRERAGEGEIARLAFGELGGPLGEGGILPFEVVLGRAQRLGPAAHLFLELLLRGGHGDGHGVEGQPELAQLVAAGVLDTHGEVAVLQPGRGLVERAHRAEDPVGSALSTNGRAGAPHAARGGR